MKKVFIIIIQFYKKVISPHKRPTCRFYPTCSSYGLEAFEKHGAIKGLGLTTLRILKCHPFHSGGYDPVPKNQEDFS